MVIFYSHPLTLYNTKQEERDIALLEKMGFDVLNPNTEEHSKNYEKFGQEYFKELVVNCDGVAFRSFPGGEIPAGVGSEVMVAYRMGKILFELPGALSKRIMNVEETREWLQNSGQR